MIVLIRKPEIWRLQHRCLPQHGRPYGRILFFRCSNVTTSPWEVKNRTEPKTRIRHWLFSPRITFQNLTFCCPSLKSSGFFFLPRTPVVVSGNCLFWHLSQAELWLLLQNNLTGEEQWRPGAPPVQVKSLCSSVITAQHCSAGMCGTAGCTFSPSIKKKKKACMLCIACKQRYADLFRNKKQHGSLNIPLDINYRQTEPTRVFTSVEEDLSAQGKMKKITSATALSCLTRALLTSTRTFSSVLTWAKQERCHWTSSATQSRPQVDNPTRSCFCVILFNSCCGLTTTGNSHSFSFIYIAAFTKTLSPGALKNCH